MFFVAALLLCDFRRNKDLIMSDKEKSIVLFDDKKIRRLWDEDQEEWYFSIIDVVDILTDSATPKRYWSDLKRKLKLEGSEVYDNIVRLKMFAPGRSDNQRDF
jgi:DNA-damage-inducible protein D